MNLSQQVLRIIGVLTLLALVSPAIPSQSQSDSHYFPESGFTVKGVFWQYWQTHGALAQQGYPLSGEFPERSEADGKVYTVQYFERAVFEKHPENHPPYDVLLKLLGTKEYSRSYREGAPNQQPNKTNGRYSPETKHWLGGLFRSYWEQNGGLAQQGYPISDEFTEYDGVTNQHYRVQYFERAIFEYHPENRSPYNVLLRRLGASRSGTYLTLGSGGVNPNPTPTPIPRDPCPAAQRSVSGFALPTYILPSAGPESVLGINGYGFSPDEDTPMILLAPNGEVVARRGGMISGDGASGLPMAIPEFMAPGVWSVIIEGERSHHRATIYFCVLGR